MEDNEILEYLKNNDENNYQLGISATLLAITAILIKNSITTNEEFENIKKQCLKSVQMEQIKNMTKEERKQIETMKKFQDLFGKIL